MSIPAPLHRSRASVIIVDALGGLVIAALAVVVSQWIRWSNDLTALLVSASVMVIALSLRRMRPGFALAAVWVATIVHMLLGLDAGVLQVGVLVVLATAAHHGTRGTLVVSGLSVPVGAIIAALYLLTIDSWVWLVFSSTGGALPIVSYAFFGALLVTALALPWVLGLLARAVRLSRENRLRGIIAEREAERSAELAEHERARAALARDVHDIVGHSLAVIISQAESVRFLDPDDTAAVHEAVQTIADTARRSLTEVRGVLETTESDPVAEGGRDAVEATSILSLDLLIDDVARARPEVHVARRGDAGEALSAPAAVAMYRVTQELLTNALRHGSPEGRLDIERTVEVDAIIVTVTNRVREDQITSSADGVTPATGTRSGTGLAGVRDRLDAVGGVLDIDETNGAFRARARVPRHAVHGGVTP